MPRAIAKTSVTSVSLEHLSDEQRRSLTPNLCSFIDMVGTATGRGTFYNTKEEERIAVEKAHQALFAIDRGIYAAALLLPGNDYSKQVGFARLLDNPRGESPSVLNAEQEAKVLSYLCRKLPAQRLLKLFLTFRGDKGGKRVNNARTRKLILRSILDNPKLDFWAVKYRRKVAMCLGHAWGKRMTGIVRSILGKEHGDRTEREMSILRDNIDRWVVVGIGAGFATARISKTYECVSFILGNEQGLTLPILSSYAKAKKDLKDGALLPPETLEGIRGRFHKDKPKAAVIELSKAQMTSGQKIAIQRAAKEAKVEVKLDPNDYDSVRLYVYAFEMGMTPDIERALKEKAKEAADGLPVKYKSIGILLDASQSMFGHETQKLRPMAVALATRDMLKAAADRAEVYYVGGAQQDHGIVFPSGYTSLAKGLVALLKRNVECVFVISDGYENAPAGRFDEVVRAARKMGITIPIYQVNPVASAEAKGVRELSKEVSALPINKPESIGLTLLRSMFELDLDRGVAGLLGLTLPLLENKGKKKDEEVEVEHG